MEEEQKLIRAILRRGSKKAADELIRAYYDEIYIFVYRQTGEREDAYDLTQECFISMLRSLPSFDPGKASFRTWLYHIASHKVIDVRRKGKLIYLPIEDQEIAVEEDFTEKLYDQELLSAIERFVCGVDPAVQEVFRLRLYGDYSFPEIAQITGQPEAKVKAQYYRLLNRIRKEMG